MKTETFKDGVLKDWNDVTTSQGMPATSTPQEARNGFYPRASGGRVAC